jgi:glycosyltransferase involved in cell wall biosynthesis
VDQLRRTPDELLIGTVAALRTEKNLVRLIDAFAKLPIDMPARLVIVGDGVERQKLEQHAVGLGLGSDVLFTGTMARPEDVLGAFDVFALSSDTEQMPFSILEAMAAGLPIAAVDVGDVKEMVAPANRAFVVPQNAERLALAIATLLHSPKARRQIGAQNRAHVRHHYGQALMFQRYAALFDA